MGHSLTVPRGPFKPGLDGIASGWWHAVGHPKQLLEFHYDYLGRRIRKLVDSWNGSAWVVAQERRNIYNGWNLIWEWLYTEGQSRSYFWGLDLSGTLQGAGGVGGLLLVQEGGGTRRIFPCC